MAVRALLKAEVASRRCLPGVGGLGLAELAALAEAVAVEV